MLVPELCQRLDEFARKRWIAVVPPCEEDGPDKTEQAIALLEEALPNAIGKELIREKLAGLLSKARKTDQAVEQLTTLADEAMVMKGLAGGGKGVLDGQFWIGSQHFTLNSVSFIDQVNDKSVEVENVKLAMSNTLTQPDPASDAAEQQLTNLNTVSIAELFPFQ